MIIFLKLGTVRAISVEFKSDFGIKPLFRKKTFHYETIVDIPYGQVTYTSGKWFPLRRASNVNEKTNKTTKRVVGSNRD